MTVSIKRSISFFLLSVAAYAPICAMSAQSVSTEPASSQLSDSARLSFGKKLATLLRASEGKPDAVSEAEYHSGRCSRSRSGSMPPSREVSGEVKKEQSLSTSTRSQRNSCRIESESPKLPIPRAPGMSFNSAESPVRS